MAVVVPDGPAPPLVRILCPGICTCWPAEWIQVAIPASAQYTCPMSGAVAFPGGNFALKETSCYPLKGKCWSYYRLDPAPDGYEGDIWIRVSVYCPSEHLSYPLLSVHYEKHTRLIGDPDPNIVVCFTRVCMTDQFCECLYPVPQHDGNIGFGHGISAVKGSDIAASPGNGICDDGATATCAFSMAPDSDQIVVKPLCYENCLCVGVPRTFPAVWSCPGSLPIPGLGFGDLSFAMQWYDVDDLPSWAQPPLTGRPYGYWIGKHDMSGTCWIELVRICGATGLFITARLHASDPMDACIAQITNDWLASGRACYCATPIVTSSQCDPFREVWTCDTGSTITFGNP